MVPHASRISSRYIPLRVRLRSDPPLSEVRFRPAIPDGWNTGVGRKPPVSGRWLV